MLVTALNYEAGTSFSPQELGTQTADLQKAFEPIFDWFRKHYPGLVKYLETSEGEDATNWPNVLSGVPWDRGDGAPGREHFHPAGCQTCHSRQSGRSDLSAWRAIEDLSRHRLSQPRYRPRAISASLTTPLDENVLAPAPSPLSHGTPLNTFGQLVASSPSLVSRYFTRPG